MEHSDTAAHLNRNDRLGLSETRMLTIIESNCIDPGLLVQREQIRSLGILPFAVRRPDSPPFFDSTTIPPAIPAKALLYSCPNGLRPHQVEAIFRVTRTPLLILSLRGIVR